jgi:diamine N-acetyltransferase
VLLRAICCGDEPVGVLLVDMECDPPYLVRFMVDAAHQRHGIGRRAVDLLIDELRRTGATSLEVSFVAAPEGGAEGFWRRCGFADTGRSIEGETVLALVL